MLELLRQFNQCNFIPLVPDSRLKLVQLFSGTPLWRSLISEEIQLVAMQNSTDLHFLNFFPGTLSQIRKIESFMSSKFSLAFSNALLFRDLSQKKLIFYSFIITALPNSLVSILLRNFFVLGMMLTYIHTSPHIFQLPELLSPPPVS